MVRPPFGGLVWDTHAGSDALASSLVASTVSGTLGIADSSPNGESEIRDVVRCDWEEDLTSPQHDGFGVSTDHTCVWSIHVLFLASHQKRMT
jgi:hypothetical protein